MNQAKIIAIANQKGGVGKTTTTEHLGIALARQGKRVLLVDADPQGSLTTCLGGGEPDTLTHTLSTLMRESIQNKPLSTQRCILQREGVDLIPANIELSELEVALISAMSREQVLSDCLASLKPHYDYILIDCMPSLGMVTVNALTAANSVIIPVQAQYLPAKGMTALLQTIHQVERRLNPSLRVEGILMTLVDARTRLSRMISETVLEQYGRTVRVYESKIPLAVAAAESSATGKSLFDYTPASKVAAAYEQLAKEVAQHGKQAVKHQSTPVR